MVDFPGIDLCDCFECPDAGGVSCPEGGWLDAYSDARSLYLTQSLAIENELVDSEVTIANYLYKSNGDECGEWPIIINPRISDPPFGAFEEMGWENDNRCPWDSDGKAEIRPFSPINSNGNPILYNQVRTLFDNIRSWLYATPRETVPVFYGQVKRGQKSLGLLGVTDIMETVTISECYTTPCVPSTVCADITIPDRGSDIRNSDVNLGCYFVHPERICNHGRTILKEKVISLADTIRAILEVPYQNYAPCCCSVSDPLDRECVSLTFNDPGTGGIFGGIGNPTAPIEYDLNDDCFVYDWAGVAGPGLLFASCNFPTLGASMWGISDSDFPPDYETPPGVPVPSIIESPCFNTLFKVNAGLLYGFYVITGKILSALEALQVPIDNFCDTIILKCNELLAQASDYENNQDVEVCPCYVPKIEAILRVFEEKKKIYQNLYDFIAYIFREKVVGCVGGVVGSEPRCNEIATGRSSRKVKSPFSGKTIGSLTTAKRAIREYVGERDLINIVDNSLRLPDTVYPLDADAHIDGYVTNRPNSNKNYRYIGFMNEFNVNSQDLNDVQEIQAEERTNITDIFYNWSWSGGEQYPYQPPGQDSQNFVTPETDEQEVTNPGPIKGPFWDGATPFTPNDFNIVVAQAEDSFINAVSPPLEFDFENDTNSLLIYFNESNYHTRITTEDGNSVGMSNKIYLKYPNEDPSNFIARVPDKEQGLTIVGLKIKETANTPTEDPSILSVNSTKRGANRIAYEFSGVSTSYGISGPTAPDFAPVVFVDHINKTVRYMNNLLLHRYK